MRHYIYYWTTYLSGKAGELVKHRIQLQMTKAIHLRAMTFSIQ